MMPQTPMFEEYRIYQCNRCELLEYEYVLPDILGRCKATDKLIKIPAEVKLEDPVNWCNAWKKGKPIKPRIKKGITNENKNNNKQK